MTTRTSKQTKIPYGRHSIDTSDVQAVASVLKSDWLSQGPKVREFERALEIQCRAPHAVAVSSGTAALHLACVASGLLPGDEVLTTPLTFLATANAILYTGARPVFCDVEPGTLNMDPSDLERKMTRKTRAILAVHYAGVSCDMLALQRIAKRHNLILIEDACHALGGIYRQRPIGSCQYSDMATFSFHPLKSITTGEGGMVMARSKAYNQKCLDLRNHGMIRDERKTVFKESWQYEVNDLGFNYRLTDIQAALGISQLKRLKGFIDRRRQIARVYFELLSKNPDLELPREEHLNDSAWHLFVIRLKSQRMRGQLMQKLADKNILTQVHYIPIHRQPYFRRLGYGQGLCPRAEDAYARMLSLPLFPALKRAEVERVAHAVNDVVQQGSSKLEGATR